MSPVVSRLFKQHISALLDQQKDTFGRSPGSGQDYSQFSIDSPGMIANRIQTLDPLISRPVSQQFQDWYSHFGAVVEGSWKYLTPASIASTVEVPRFKEIVAAHREYWDNSAPMQFPNSQLSVFALIGDLDDGDMIYMVWPKFDTVEPQLWEYLGQAETRYENLVEYILSLLNK